MGNYFFFLVAAKVYFSIAQFRFEKLLASEANPPFARAAIGRHFRVKNPLDEARANLAPDLRDIFLEFLKLSRAFGLLIEGIQWEVCVSGKCESLESL